MKERDQIAAAMLRLVLENTQQWCGNAATHEDFYWDDMISAATVAYRLADSMIEARKWLDKAKAEKHKQYRKDNIR